MAMDWNFREEFMYILLTPSDGLDSSFFLPSFSLPHSSFFFEFRKNAKITFDSFSRIFSRNDSQNFS